MTFKKFILSHKILYEAYFFISRKKLNINKINSKIKGLSYQPIKRPYVSNLIVSLTTYGDRIFDLKYTLFSLITQTMLPEKIIVWLSKEEFSMKTIPNELLVFQFYNVEFHFCNDLRSYKKLIPSLELYPDKYIVTADDDIYYKKSWLKKLWNEHLKYPDCVVAHIVHKIVRKPDGAIDKYQNWKHNIKSNSCSELLFPTSGGGVLWSTKYLYKDISNSTLFLKLAPNADDVWFFFMLFLQNSSVRIVKRPSNKLIYVDIYKEYGLNNKVTLSSDNVGNCQNDVQIDNTARYYNLSL